MDPQIWEKIQGEPCNHLFKKGFGGRSPHFFGSLGIGCGSNAESMAFRQRFQATDALFRLYSRVPDNDLGKSTIVILDGLFPPDASLQDAHRLNSDYSGTVAKLEMMIGILGVIESRQEWSAALVFFQSGFKGTPPLIADAEFLSGRMKSEYTSIRRACAEIVSNNRDLDSPELLVALLDDEDESVVKQAVSTIIFRHQLNLFPKMLRKGKPDEYEREQIQSYADEDFEKLFSQDDAVVDDACYLAIANDQRLRLLDMIVARLNHRNSEAGEKAVRQLFRGPNPLSKDSEIEPWDRIEILDAPLEKLKERVAGGISKSGDSTGWKLLHAIKSLAKTMTPHFGRSRRVLMQAVPGRVSTNSTAPSWPRP